LRPIELLPLTHSWPIFEQGQRLDLGYLHDRDGAAWALPAIAGPILAQTGIGLWECDLADDALSWSAQVHDLFGLPREARPTRHRWMRLTAAPICANGRVVRLRGLKRDVSHEYRRI
jgi:PAS domain-containing protein